MSCSAIGLCATLVAHGKTHLGHTNSCGSPHSSLAHRETGLLTYLGKHWRGEFPLAISFWVNLILINIGIRLFQTWFTEASPIENPVSASQLAIVYISVALAIVYPWQIIGLWRSANKHIEETKKRLWGGGAKVVVVLGLLAILGNLTNSWPIYKDLFQLGFGKDEYGEYRVALIEDGSFIHIEGGLGFGISENVRRLIAKNPSVKAVILDSSGGRIYEGRELSKIILNNDLDTYSLRGCYSACGTAFISGKKRYLGTGANLAFHQYQSPGKGLDPYIDIPSEQKKDLVIYLERGVSQEFIDSIFIAEKDDLWYPTIDEMLNAGVIHGIVNPSDLRPIEYGSIDSIELERVFGNFPAYQTIKKYEPETYNRLIGNLVEKMREGASLIEIQQIVGNYIELLAEQHLPKTSDRALIMFARATILSLGKLEKIDPILCMKALDPQRYGTIRFSKYLSSEDLMPMMDAVNLVIIDSYGSNDRQLDVEAAESLMAEIVIQLGDDALYLEAQGLKNRSDYSRACKSIIKFYRLILLNDDEMSANGLRYAFSP